MSMPANPLTDCFILGSMLVWILEQMIAEMFSQSETSPGEKHIRSQGESVYILWRQWIFYYKNQKLQGVGCYSRYGICNRIDGLFSNTWVFVCVSFCLSFSLQPTSVLMPVLSNPLGRKEQAANHYPGTTGLDTRLFISILIAFISDAPAFWKRTKCLFISNSCTWVENLWRMLSHVHSYAW